MQKYDNSIAALNQAEPFAAKEKDPEKEKAKVYKLRGAANYSDEQVHEAASDLTGAMRVNQSDWADFSILGVCYFKLDRLDDPSRRWRKLLP